MKSDLTKCNAYGGVARIPTVAGVHEIYCTRVKDHNGSHNCAPFGQLHVWRGDFVKAEAVEPVKSVKPFDSVAFNDLFKSFDGLFGTSVTTNTTVDARYAAIKKKHEATKQKLRDATQKMRGATARVDVAIVEAQARLREEERLSDEAKQHRLAAEAKARTEAKAAEAEVEKRPWWAFWK